MYTSVSSELYWLCNSFCNGSHIFKYCSWELCTLIHTWEVPCLASNPTSSIITSFSWFFAILSWKYMNSVWLCAVFWCYPISYLNVLFITYLFYLSMSKTCRKGSVYLVMKVQNLLKFVVRGTLNQTAIAFWISYSL